jgi:hypothetical protein
MLPAPAAVALKKIKFMLRTFEVIAAAIVAVFGGHVMSALGFFV